MQPSLDLLAVLNLLGAGQGLLMTLALAGVKRGDRFANRVLAALTATISVIVGGAVLVSTNYVFVFPHLSRVHHPFVYLAGPLLLLYLKALTSGARRLAPKDLWHFAPAALCALYLAPYYLQSREAKLRHLAAEYYEDSLGGWYYFRSALFIAQFLVYVILIARLLAGYSRRADRGSVRGRRVLFQVRFFAAASVVFLAGAALRYALDQSARWNLLVPLGASVLVYALGYVGLSKPEALAGGEGEEAQPPPARKYERSTLTPERSERYLKRLREVMEAERPYADGGLTLQKLADKLSVPAQHLSQVINERTGQTFSDFVNAYRVEEAKRRLSDPRARHFTVLSIAEEVGFSSKSSFNLVFKKHTGMTPSEFRRASGGDAAAPAR